MKTITRTMGYHAGVTDYICDATDVDKPVDGGAATGFKDGDTCYNVDEKIEYIVYKEKWNVYVTLG